MAVKTRNEYIAKARKREEREIDNLIEKEKQEIRDIYERFQGGIGRRCCSDNYRKKENTGRYYDKGRAWTN